LRVAADNATFGVSCRHEVEVGKAVFGVDFQGAGRFVRGEGRHGADLAP
jgi:hypothetical protein